MGKVRFLPTGEEVEVKIGENFLKAAIRSDVGVRYSCGGAPSCAMCRVVVQSGEEYLNPLGQKEVDLLGNTYFITKKRLACQTCMDEDGIVELDISEHLEKEEPDYMRFRKAHASEVSSANSSTTAGRERRSQRNGDPSVRPKGTNKKKRRPSTNQR